MLHIHCLGPLAITVNAQTHPHFATDRARALLVYLAVSEKRPFRRDELAALLWPEQPDQQARQNLRKTLSRLRQAAPDLPLLDTNYKGVSLNHAAIDCDANQFNQELLTVEQHNHANLTQCMDCMARLQTALAFYQGTFLQGFYLSGAAAFEEWVLLTRENLQQQAIHAFTILIDHYEQTGQDTQLIETAQTLLALEPWHERTQRQLLHAFSRNGQRVKALAHYEAYAALLEQELGITPESETIQLYHQLQLAEVPLTPKPVWYGFPAEVSGFIGRTPELTQIIAQITAPDCRLLTITGVGGMGKTRLAVQAVLQITAVAFPDGLFFIPLSQLTSASQIVPLLATQIGLSFQGTASPFLQLQEFLQKRRLLLLLDNFEHLMEGAHLVADLLKVAPGLTCLVTSRHALNLQGEWRLNLQGLDEVEEAMTLFITRAQRYGVSQFDEADRICVRHIAQLVQGMPLALEMAAAWLRAYDLPTITQEIAHNLDFLVSPWQDLPPRHRSMRAVFAGSWQLLSSEEQRLFAHMSIFRGKFTLTAARAITAATILSIAHLVDQSLIQHTQTGHYLIHELLRQFAAEKLAEMEEETAVSHAHARYYLTFLQQQGQYLKGKHSRAALKRIQGEFENIRQGWQWVVAHTETTLIADVLPVLTDVFLLSGLYEDGVALLDQAAETLSQQYTTLHLLLHSSQASLLYEWGHFHKARQITETILAADATPQITTSAHLLLGQIYQQQGNYTKMGEHVEIACKQASTTAHKTKSQLLRGQWLLALGQRQPAWELLQAVLTAYYEADNLWGASRTLYALANVAATRREDARPYLLQMLDIQRQIGSSFIQQQTLANLALSSMYRGDYAAALDHCQEAITLAEDIGSAMRLADTQITAGHIWRRIGSFPTAQRQYLSALDTFLRFNHSQGIATSYHHLGLLHHQMGDNQQALSYCEKAWPFLAQQNHPLLVSLLDGCVGRAHAGLGDWQKAISCFEKALNIQQQLQRPGREMNSRGLLAEAYLQQGQIDRALDQVEIVLAYLQTTAIHKSEEPWRLQWQCYQVLAAAADIRARPLLAHIYHKLTIQAAGITPEKQPLFWQAVPTNRAVKQAVTQDANHANA